MQPGRISSSLWIWTILIIVFTINSQRVQSDHLDIDINSNKNEEPQISVPRSPSVSVHLPTPQKSKISSIKISNHGSVGYKRLSKKYRDELLSSPASTTIYLKKNRIYSSQKSNISNSTTKPWKYLTNDLSAADIDLDPPPVDEVAKMARYVVAASNWLYMSTFSSRSPIVGFPFTNLFSTSDGPIGMSSGNPYMYMTPLDMSVLDLKEDSRASVAMSLAQGDYCAKQNFDPEDPRCARVILSGNIIKIPNKSIEEDFARESLFSRHTQMQHWPKDHGWFFAKMNITNIILLDFFGGIKTIAPDDYFKVVMSSNIIH